MISKKDILAHIEAHDGLLARDVIKFLYQGEFSTGHIIGDGCEKRIAEERRGLKAIEGLPLFEDVGEKYARFNLNAAGADKISDRTIAMAMRSCQNICFEDAVEEFKEDLRTVDDIINHSEAYIDILDYHRESLAVMVNGYKPVSHSECYRELFSPAYRLVPMWFKTYFEVIAQVQELYESGKAALVAIDGGSASGKSTLAYNLAQLFDCNVWHMDDFFLQKHQRYPERFAEAGGNVDYERFLSEVFKPLINGEDVLLRRFDCSEMKIREAEKIPFKRLNIVEGAYCCRPEFESFYKLKIFLKTDCEEQKKRILNRNGERMLTRFLNEWIPMEKTYFEYFDIENKADIVIQA